MRPQIMAISRRLASVLPSTYRWVVCNEAWPASCWTSRSDPPASETFLAALVMNVRRAP